MSTAAEKLMTVDEFLVWGEGREGRWELLDGRPIAMSAERVAHAETKAEAWAALRRAIECAGAPCRAMPDGMTVRRGRVLSAGLSLDRFKGLRADRAHGFRRRSKFGYSRRG